LLGREESPYKGAARPAEGRSGKLHSHTSEIRGRGVPSQSGLSVGTRMDYGAGGIWGGAEGRDEQLSSTGFHEKPPGTAV